jgi:hypothetical protein
MSFTFGISKASTLTLAALACALTANHCAAGPHPSAAACGKYADKAWYSVQDMKKSGCAETGDMGPGRFSQSLKEHRDWCTNAATPETMAFEEQQRESVRSACMYNKLKELICQKYATDAVQMSNQYQINRCTTEHHPVGRFDYRFQAHYNWCMYTADFAKDEPNREEAARDTELKSCKEKSDQARYTPVKKLKIKASTYQESTEEDESSEAAQTEEPTPKRRTQKIVVGNRYVEVPAFGEDTEADEGSRVGSVVKAGAAAVVVGTAAVATGVVAAKALEYAEGHKGGISEAAYDLKEKLKDRLDGGGFNKVATGLKEKIKDGLDGGGFNKVATGLKEKIKDRFDGGGINKVASSLKDKIKDRLTPSRSGGLSKVASGLKEKLKSRLSGGGGGGGLGSKLKSVAKAGGGLLRRLAGR